MGSRLGWYILQIAIVIGVTVFGQEVNIPGREPPPIGISFVMGVITAFGVTYGLSSLFQWRRGRKIKRSLADRDGQSRLPKR